MLAALALRTLALAIGLVLAPPLRTDLQTWTTPNDGTSAPNGRSNLGSKCVGFKALDDVSSQAAILVHEWRHIREGHGHSGPVMGPAQQSEACHHWTYQLDMLRFLCCISSIDPASTPVDPFFLEIDCDFVAETKLVGSIMLNECFGDDEFQFSLNAPCTLCQGA